MLSMMKLTKAAAVIALPLSVGLWLGGFSLALAQTTAGPPSSTSTTGAAPPWHNPDLDAPPTSLTAPPAGSPSPPPPPAAATPMAAPPPSPPSGLPGPGPGPAGPSRNECREFQQTITIGGQPQHAHGTACRQPDGTWKIVR